MNKKNFCVGLVVFFISFVLCFCVGCKEEKRDELLTKYQLNLTYDETIQTLYGSENVDYINTSSDELEQICFHLYPNAFRKDAKRKVVSSAKESEAFPNGISYGEIEIERVVLEEEEAIYEIVGEDQNILSVQLGKVLAPYERVVLEIDFSVTLANIHHRLGYGEKTINFGNFYPIVCVYEEANGFRTDLYHSNGDPFYSDCADYYVEIDCKDDFVVASSGVILSQAENEGRRQTVVEGKKIRDFCFVLSANLECVSKDVDGVIVNYYGYHGDENMDRWLDLSAQALTTFNDMFGDYPYSQLSVVKSNFVHGGMEYPNLVLISDTLDEEDFGYVIVHEIAHQWWYGVVGSDQYNHAWQDEALAEYSTLLFYKKHPEYGEDYKEMVSASLKSYKTFTNVYEKVNGEVDTSMDRPIDSFSTEPEYVQNTYVKGVLMMDAIRQGVGEKRVLKAWKLYYETYKFQNATPEDFVYIFTKVAGKDVESFIRSWLDGKVVIE